MYGNNARDIWKIMDYRGSKSIVGSISMSKLESVFVKEQRVDGSYIRAQVFIE